MTRIWHIFEKANDLNCRSTDFIFLEKPSYTQYIHKGIPVCFDSSYKLVAKIPSKADHKNFINSSKTFGRSEKHVINSFH